MKKTTSAAFMGVVFAWGLGISQMTRPPKILGFLNLAGEWDPSLLLVLIAAAGIYYLGYTFIITKPVRTAIAAKLVGKEQLTPLVLVGAVIFGFGWGLIGLCPGPAITDLLAFRHDILIFVVGMLLGIYTAKAYVGVKR
jgi:hypothetical protein